MADSQNTDITGALLMHLTNNITHNFLQMQDYITSTVCPVLVPCGYRGIHTAYVIQLCDFQLQLKREASHSIIQSSSVLLAVAKEKTHSASSMY